MTEMRSLYSFKKNIKWIDLSYDQNGWIERKDEINNFN